MVLTLIRSTDGQSLGTFNATLVLITDDHLTRSRIFILLLIEDSMLASGTQDRGFEAVGFLGRKKIRSMPSFGGEVKPSVPCRQICGMLKEPCDLRGSRNRRPN
jgi:hypothetical protein